MTWFDGWNPNMAAGLCFCIGAVVGVIFTVASFALAHGSHSEA